MTVPLSRPLIRLASSRPHLPRRTLRLRLTLLYGGLFLLSGAALLAITYLLVVNATSGFIFSTQTGHGRGHLTVGEATANHQPPKVASFPSGKRPSKNAPPAGQAAALADQQHSSELHQLLIQSGIALAGMALASILLGWIVAGRALRPLRTITQSAREISASNLHERLALDGPDDELKDLGDTIDALLARLESSFQAERAFVANASHELRTPLALTRAMLQFALADPGLTFEALKATCADVLDAGAQQEQLIEALLTLARSQQGLEHRQSVELSAIVGGVIAAHRQQAAARRITIDATLTPATISGDPHLLGRLTTNLVENALRYNHPGGAVQVALNNGAQDVTLSVSNTGPAIEPDQVQRLLQPFRRLAPDRTADSHGHGLGLSIVAAIATAHDATLTVHAHKHGGLQIAVTFPLHEPSNDGTLPNRVRMPDVIRHRSARAYS